MPKIVTLLFGIFFLIRRLKNFAASCGECARYCGSIHRYVTIGPLDPR